VAYTQCGVDVQFGASGSGRKEQRMRNEESTELKKRKANK
jgi:hypothetical protein